MRLSRVLIISIIVVLVLFTTYIVYSLIKNNKNNKENNSSLLEDKNSTNSVDPCANFKYDYTITLKKGDKGCNVRELQRTINKFSNSKLLVDGIFGQKTEDALYSLIKRREASLGLLYSELY